LKVCLAAGIPLAIASGNAQGVWLEAIEERVAVTSKILGVMKSIKMTGLTDVIANNLRHLRSEEIKTSFAFRLYNVLILTCCLLAFSFPSKQSNMGYSIRFQRLSPSLWVRCLHLTISQ